MKKVKIFVAKSTCEHFISILLLSSLFYLLGFSIILIYFYFFFRLLSLLRRVLIITLESNTCSMDLIIHPGTDFCCQISFTLSTQKCWYVLTV